MWQITFWLGLMTVKVPYVLTGLTIIINVQYLVGNHYENYF